MAVTASLDIRPLLDRLGRINDPAKVGQAMQEISADLLGDVALGFKAQRDPWGNPWAALSDATLKQRRKSGRGAQILRDTGVLQNSIHAVHDMLSATISVGPNAAYGAKHQAGIGTKRRAFFPLDEAGNVKLSQEINASVMSIIESAVMGGA